MKSAPTSPPLMLRPRRSAHGYDSAPSERNNSGGPSLLKRRHFAQSAGSEAGKNLATENAEAQKTREKEEEETSGIRLSSVSSAVGQDSGFLGELPLDAWDVLFQPIPRRNPEISFRRWKTKFHALCGTDCAMRRITRRMETFLAVVPGKATPGVSDYAGKTPEVPAARRLQPAARRWRTRIRAYPFPIEDRSGRTDALKRQVSRRARGRWRTEWRPSRGALPGSPEVRRCRRVLSPCDEDPGGACRA